MPQNLSIQKQIDTSTNYATFDTTWWLNNDDSPNIWDKDGLLVDRQKWEAWFKTNWTELSVTYTSRGEKEFLMPKSMTSKTNTKSTKDKEIYLHVKYGIVNKDECIVDLMIYWSKSIDSAKIKSMIEAIYEMVIIKTEKSPVYMVVQDEHGLDLRSFDINTPELDIELNYGKEWAEKHEHLVKTLTRESKKGIALLHGLPGTGKSMYIRYLISLMAEERTMIYLPNQLIQSITDPGFIPLMADYPNSILIIEDAEEAIKSRKQGGATVDKLLNLSDGIISDFLGTQIICTFNSDIATIDEALLRKGRLILKHEFGRLTKEQAQKLSDKLGFKTVMTKEMTLSEVYNQEEKYSEEMKGSGTSTRETIGFKR